MSATIIPFEEAAERARLRRQSSLELTDWLWLAAICALPVWVPVLMGLTLVEIVRGDRR